MLELALIIVPLVVAGGMLLAFRAGANVAKGYDRVVMPEPNIELPAEEEAEKAPTEKEIFEDMERSRTLMTGYDFNN